MITTKKRRIIAAIAAVVLVIGGSVIAVQSISAARERAALQEALVGLNEAQAGLVEASQDRDKATGLLEEAQNSALDAVTLADKLVEVSQKYIGYIEPTSSVDDLIAARDALIEVTGIERGDEGAVTFTSLQVDAVAQVPVADTTSIDEVKATTERVRDAITKARAGTEEIIAHTEAVSDSTRDVVSAALAVVTAAETSGKAFGKPDYAPAEPWEAYQKALEALGADLDGSEDLAALVETYGHARETVLSEAEKAKAAAEEEKARQSATTPRKSGTSKPPKSSGGSTGGGGRVIPIDPNTGQPLEPPVNDVCYTIKICYG